MTREPELDALLARVRERPDDLAARQVYADALSQRGDPRGEFIAVQCALLRLPAGDSAERRALHEREAALLRAHEPAWLAGEGFDVAVIAAGLGGGVRATDLRFAWRGGFVDALELGTRGRRLGPDGAKKLAQLAPLSKLRRLDLAYKDIGPAGARALLSSLATPNRLEVLSLYSNELGDAGAAAVAGAPQLAGLRELDLSRNEIKPDGVVALAKSKHLANLESLNLTRNGAGRVGYAAVVGAKHLARLRVLRAYRNNVRDAGPKALAEATHLTSLEHVDLSRNGVSAKGVATLCDAPHLASLAQLDLAMNGIGDAGAIALANAAHLTGLARLDVSMCDVTDVGIEALLASSRLTKLRHLHAVNARVGAPTRAALLERFGPSVFAFAPSSAGAGD